MVLRVERLFENFYTVGFLQLIFRLIVIQPLGPDQKLNFIEEVLVHTVIYV